MGRKETALISHFARRKSRFLSSLPFGSSQHSDIFFSFQTFKNKFARVTSLLETLKYLPLALRKKFSLLTMTG